MFLVARLIRFPLPLLILFNFGVNHRLLFFDGFPYAPVLHALLLQLDEVIVEGMYNSLARSLVNLQRFVYNLLALRLFLCIASAQRYIFASRFSISARFFATSEFSTGLLL